MQPDFNSHTSFELLTWTHQETFSPRKELPLDFLIISDYCNWNTRKKSQKKSSFNRTSGLTCNSIRDIMLSLDQSELELECGSINRQLFEDLPVLKRCQHAQLLFVLNPLNPSLSEQNDKRGKPGNML